jgi:hypothetical protein
MEKAGIPIACADVNSREEVSGDCRYLTCSQCAYQTESQAELLFHEVLHGEPITDPSVTDVAGHLPVGLETTAVQNQVIMFVIYV